MSHFNDNLYSKGPTMVLPSQQNQLFNATDTSMSASPFVAPNNDATSPSIYDHHSTTWNPSSGRPPLSTNPSRKRSRDETTFESASADGSYFPSQQTVITPAVIPEEEPIYGEGMILLNPRTGMSISAESQTGTWFEEKAEAETLNRHIPVADEPVRPEMAMSRKSQRMDPTAPKPDDLTQSVVAPDSPTKSAIEPSVDEFTLSLGIGWTRMSNEDPAMEAAARGWAKYVDNHYATQGVHGAQILSKSKGLNAYLVGASEGFFLFSEDLTEGRLVGRNWDSTLMNLRNQPMTFEGTEVLSAVKTPELEARDGPMVNGGTTNQNGINGSWNLDGGAVQANGQSETTATAAGGGMELD